MKSTKRTPSNCLCNSRLRSHSRLLSAPWPSRSFSFHSASMKSIHAIIIILFSYSFQVRAQVVVTEWIGTGNCGFKINSAEIATVGKSSESSALSGGLLPSPFSNPSKLSPSSATPNTSTSSSVAIPSSPTSSAFRSGLLYRSCSLQYTENFQRKPLTITGCATVSSQLPGCYSYIQWRYASSPRYDREFYYF